MQIHARVAGGLLGRSGARALLGRLDELLRQAPYDVVRAPAEIVDVAESQVKPLGRHT